MIAYITYDCDFCGSLDMLRSMALWRVIYIYISHGCLIFPMGDWGHLKCVPVYWQKTKQTKNKSDAHAIAKV